MSHVCPQCNSFPLEDFFWWVSTAKKCCSWWCAICGETHEWGARNRILVVHLGTNEDEANVFRAHAFPQGPCENLINALKLLANQQKDGDKSDSKHYHGLKEKFWVRNTNGLRSFAASDNCTAAEVGPLRRVQRPFRL